MKVSIHALLAECDLHYHITLNYVQRFNPRTPCGVRLLALLQVSRLTRFQSTHSLRSATQDDAGFHPGHEVSIHALLAECDRRYADTTLQKSKFQSTHSLRSATCSGMQVLTKSAVSIHALLAECDRTPRNRRSGHRCFNPRTPCGVRQKKTEQAAVINTFQSTHSLRSATDGLTARNAAYGVSIHALLAECDLFPSWAGLTRTCFNPRTPCGVRLPANIADSVVQLFQSTHSLRSATDGA